jgi:hypothetical protein
VDGRDGRGQPCGIQLTGLRGSQESVAVAPHGGAGRDLFARGARRSYGPIQTAPRIAKQCEQTPALGGEHRAAPPPLSGPRRHQGTFEDLLSPPQVLPGVTIGPSDLPHSSQQRAPGLDL